MEVERELDSWLPRYRPGSSSREIPFETGRERPIPLPLDPLENSIAVQEVTEPATAARIAAAVANWREQSNGDIETRVFRLDPQLTEEGLSAGLLCSLGLGCLRGTPAANIHAGRIPACEVLMLLFCAASNGGAYNRGLGGAYGRFAAWQSLAALAGASANAPIEDVASLAEECTWVAFDAPDWFARVAWDLALLAVRSDRQSLAVLAATDYD
jgi:hypothetical protein